MKRTHIFLPEKTLSDLRKLSDESGLPVAEHIRRAVDEYMAEKLRKQGRAKK